MAVESLAATGGFVPGAVRTFGVVAEGVELGSVPVPAILQSRLGVDQRWQRRGLGASLMWHALGVATSVAPALRARLVVAHAEPEAATGILGRLGFRAFDSDPRWGYLPMRDLEATVRSHNTNRKLRDAADDVAFTGQLSPPPTHDGPQSSPGSLR